MQTFLPESDLQYYRYQKACKLLWISATERTALMEMRPRNPWVQMPGANSIKCFGTAAADVGENTLVPLVRCCHSDSKKSYRLDAVGKGSEVPDMAIGGKINCTSQSCINLSEQDSYRDIRTPARAGNAAMCANVACFWHPVRD